VPNKKTQAEPGQATLVTRRLPTYRRSSQITKFPSHLQRVQPPHFWAHAVKQNPGHLPPFKHPLHGLQKAQRLLQLRHDSAARTAAPNSAALGMSCSSGPSERLPGGTGTANVVDSSTAAEVSHSTSVLAARDELQREQPPHFCAHVVRQNPGHLPPFKHGLHGLQKEQRLLQLRHDSAERTATASSTLLSVEVSSCGAAGSIAASTTPCNAGEASMLATGSSEA